MPTGDTSNFERLDVLGVGHAIVDVLQNIDERTREKLGLAKGKMTLLTNPADCDVIQSAFGGISKCVVSPGGSAANTVAAMAAVGVSAGFIGKVGSDPQGDAFASGMLASGVRFYGGAPGRLPTGVCCIAVSSDGERTMATYLGASRELRAEGVESRMLSRTRILYAETYLWDDAHLQGCIRGCFSETSRAGGETALSLSDPFCVERHAHSLRNLIDSGTVDLVFGNREEVSALYPDLPESRMAEFFASRTKLFCRTLGADGAVLYAGGREFRIPAAPCLRVLDATGAGDLFAAGVLYGRLKKLTPRECGRLGALAASYILERMGGRAASDFAQFIERSFDNGPGGEN